jgi:hypothetical protein
MHIIEEIQRWPGPEIRIDCPACGARDVVASTFDQQIKDKYYGLITLWVQRSSWVVCPECRIELYSKVDASSLSDKSIDELAELIYPRASFIKKSLAILALPFAVFPLLGQVMAIIAIIANWKSHGWPKTVSFVALGLSFFCFLVIAILIVLDV